MAGIVSICKQQLGDNLVSIMETKVPQQTIVVVKELDFVVVDLIKDAIGELEPPMLFSEEELLNARDVFPVEFLSIKSDYKVRHGKDVFKHMHIDKKHVRHQLEFEFRSKLIVLRQRYLDSSDASALVNTIIPTIVPLCRAYLFLEGEKIPTSTRKLLDRVLDHHLAQSYVLKDIDRFRVKDPTKVIEDVMRILQEFSKKVNEEP